MAVTYRALALCFCMISASSHSSGILRFASYYGDHMVLQRSPEKAVLWGYGPEGAQVTVYLSGLVNQKTSPATVVKGIWQVTLEPVGAGGPYNVTAVTENSTSELTDVLFGDVWLCGGQSNMYFTTSQIFNASKELALAPNYPHVRTFMVALNASETELIDLMEVELPWSVPSASGLANFSAVCWLFGRYLHKKLNYPIGLVESCWGGTPIEAWSSPRALQQCGLGQNETRPPKNGSSVLWNAMIHPLLKTTIKGVIWYQGEANADYHQDKYNCSFPTMIDDWRKAFHQGSGKQTALDFPFGFVQLSTFIKNSTDDSFPNIRWHQTADIGFVPNYRMHKTFMAVAIDLPDETSPYGTIHPRDKQDVAHRLLLGALAVAYKQDVPYRGPFPKEIYTTETLINITYDQTISVRKLQDNFEVCCSNTQFCLSKSHWISVPIMHSDLTSVLLPANLCPPTEEVVAFRYAWRDWPCDFKACAVYSSSGILPGPPFIINRYPAPGRILEDNRYDEF